MDVEKFLTLLTWEEYVAPEVLSGFSETTGITVRYETFADADEIEGRLQSHPGRYDVVIVDYANVSRFQKLHLLQPLNHNQLENFHHLGAKYTDLEIDPGNRYSIPYLWGTTLIAYRKDKIPAPERSWQLLWDSRYRNRIAMMNERTEAIGVALIKNGYSLNDRSSSAMEQVKNDLLHQISQLRATYIEGVPSALKTAFQEGAWAAMAYSGDAAMLALEDPNIGYFIPAEGCAIWMDHCVISRTSRNLTESHQFIDYLLSGPIAAENSNYLCYASPNDAALPFIENTLLEDPGVFPSDEVLNRCEFGGMLTVDRERPVNDLWRELMTELQRLTPHQKDLLNPLTQISQED